MNYRQLQLEVIDSGFDTETVKLAQIRNWLNAAYSKTWDADDWYFKHVQAVTLSATINDPTPTMPTDFAKAEALFDANADQLTYLDPTIWRDSYENSTATGMPDAYTVINREIYLGPTPNANFSLTLSYERRIAHLNAAGSVIAGVLALDTDNPIWGAEYHYILVLEAAITGKQLKGDPNWQQLVPARDELQKAMRENLVGQTDNELAQTVGAWPGARSWWE